MDAAERTPNAVEVFSEKSFYLREFRGRTLALALGDAAPTEPSALESVLKELEDNATRVVLIARESLGIERFAGGEAIPASAPRFEGAVWRRLQTARRAAVAVADGDAFDAATRQVVLRLRVSKLVWLERAGALLRRDGSRLSFTDLGELRQLVRDPQRDENARRGALLAEILHMIEGGLPAVSVCTVEGLADELFTYGGSGTFFAAERYIAVRRLGIDDFDAACDLIARGVAEGYLAPRSAEEVEELLASSFGAFVEGRHLAGIAALVPYEARVAEIASVYTLTRFLGEGVGGHLIAFAVERARELGCSFVFACTTSDRVLRFFERNGFRRARPDELPDVKWTGYDDARRATLHCLRRDLA